MPKGIYKRNEKHKQHARNIAKARKGKPSNSPTKFKKGQIAPNKGKKLSKITGENHWNWKGGLTPLNHKIRCSLEYKLWRTAVFERDGYTCVWCGKVGGDLNADHIKPFAHYPELRLAIDNGRTLCVSCHRTTYKGILKTKSLDGTQTNL